MIRIVLLLVIRVTSTGNKIKKPKHFCQQVKWINFWIANPTYWKTMATNKHEIKYTLMDTEQKLSKTLFKVNSKRG